MISLPHLIEHIFTSTGYETVEATYELPTEDITTSNPPKIYVDYNMLVSPLEEAINSDSSSEVGNSISLITSVVLDAKKSDYPQVLLDLYKACEHYEPESPIKPIIRVLSFSNGEFLTSGDRRIFKSNWVVTFDRFIR